MLDKRLNDKGKNWRHIAKSLTVLDYLIRYGSGDVVLWAKDNLYVIKTLREFQVSDSTGRDQGAIIRVKAKELTSLLLDDERLRQERDLARERMRDRRSRRRGGRRGDDDFENEGDDNQYDDELQRALEESRMTAEQDERKRRERSGSDASLQRALQLSLEEEEMRKKNNNLLDLDDTQNQTPNVFGFYSQDPNVQQQQQQQIIGYDMFATATS
ncbi:unnamed protein product [[Candida] boidinii]|nr:unnamed protein product [[Candida] boidinii]